MTYDSGGWTLTEAARLLREPHWPGSRARRARKPVRILCDGGGGGNRTHVRGWSTTGFYTLSRFFWISPRALRRAGSRPASPLISLSAGGPPTSSQPAYIDALTPTHGRIGEDAPPLVRQRLRSWCWRLLNVPFLTRTGSLGVPPALSDPRRVLSPPRVRVDDQRVRPGAPGCKLEAGGRRGERGPPPPALTAPRTRRTGLRPRRRPAASG